MKLVSPAQRGTTCMWTWSTTPAPAIRPRFQPRLKPCGPMVSARAPRAEEASWCTSAASSRSSPPKSPAWRLGAIMRWPEAYGYLLRSTKARSPRWTTRPLSSSTPRARQNTHPSCSSACSMYSRRHGAQSCFTLGSQPAPPAEDAEECNPEHDHQPDYDPKALGATLARDMRVHPEDARDQRERKQNHADHCEELEPVLLPVRDDRLIRILERLDDLLVVVEEVPDALGCVDDVVEVELEVLGEEALGVALEQAQGRTLGLDDLAVRDDLL